jgi:hypothetical protein
LQISLITKSKNKCYYFRGSQFAGDTWEYIPAMRVLVDQIHDIPCFRPSEWMTTIVPHSCR